MRSRPFVVLFVIASLLVAATPSVSAYKGLQLDRAAVDVSLVMTDQNGVNQTIETLEGDILVTAFIFTRCPDVCPIITQTLSQVQQNMDEDLAEHVGIVSISVDPEYDTPERLAEFAELHGVDWPHLTGDLETMEDVWATFGVMVDKMVIDAHVGMDHYDPSHATMVYVDTEGNSTMKMYKPTGWHLSEAMAYEAGWEVNASVSEFGHYVTAINGVESSQEWWWALQVWNETSSAWEESAVGIDSLDALEHDNLAWAASNANLSNLAAPSDDMASMQVLYPDNTTDSQMMMNITAWHLSMAAFAKAGIEVSMPSSAYGHFMESIDNVSAPEDWSWFWQLHTWNETNMTWEESQVGMDEIINPDKIAWAPSTFNDSDIPTPWMDQMNSGEEVCDGHGWEMGQGEMKHCMCDDGYEWPEGDMLSCVLKEEPEYSVGHSTITYILDSKRRPKVAWTGDDWNADDFIQDLETLAVKEGYLEGDQESEGLPGFTLPMVLATSAIAAIAYNGISSLSREEE